VRLGESVCVCEWESGGGGVGGGRGGRQAPIEVVLGYIQVGCSFAEWAILRGLINFGLDGSPSMLGRF
jgi:hypothetical protein